MQEPPVPAIDSVLDYLITLLRQFAGGPGPLENNLMRFGLPAVLWAALLLMAWSQHRDEDPSGSAGRERWLVWAFGLGFLRESFMFFHISMRLITGASAESAIGLALEPVEHALAMMAMIVVAGAYILYLRRNERLAERYLLIGLVASVLCLLITTPWWQMQIRQTPDIKFHSTWAAWPFHVTASILIWAAIALLWRAESWLRTVVILALGFYVVGESIMLVNLATDKRFAYYICPIGNTFHTLAIPLLGYVYLREQALQKRATEQELDAYREHLEDLVADRTAELTNANVQLRQEIADRQEAQAALARLSRNHALILNSAGEGIFGVALDGCHTFVNRAAADMLGYAPEELIGQRSHATWHHTRADGTDYPEAECPLHSGYKSGLVRRGDDQVFWRRDGTSFPVQYISTPIFEEGKLQGAVVVFQDISARKRAEAEINHRNAELAMQNTIAATISQSLDLEATLNNSLDIVLRELDVEAGCVFLTEDGKVGLWPAALRAHSATGDGSRLWRTPVCQTIVQQAVATGKPIVHNLADPSIEALPDPHEAATRTMLALPLLAKNRAVGALMLTTHATTQRDPGLADTPNLDLLTAIGQQIGIAIENAQLYREIQRWAQELALLHEASVSLSTSLNLPQLCGQVTSEVCRLLACDAAAIFTWSERPAGSKDAGEIGTEDIEVYAYGLPDSDGVPGEMLLRLQELPWLAHPAGAREFLVAEDVANDLRFPPQLHTRLRIGALLGLPLVSAGRTLGFILVFSREGPRRWRQDEIDLAKNYADLSALIIEKARLHQQAELAAALQERQHIAADVHDGLAQTLSSLGHRVDGLVELVEAGHRDEALATADDIREVIDRASQEVRQLISSLQEQVKLPRSLQALIQETVDAAVAKGSGEVRFDTDIEAPLWVSPAVSEQVVPVIGEALINAQKHSGARRILVSLHRDDGEWAVTIRDDGRGFDPARPALDGHDHFGLSIMRARAARIGGRVDIHSAPGSGTLVVLRWPAAHALEKVDS